MPKMEFGPIHLCWHELGAMFMRSHPSTSLVFRPIFPASCVTYFADLRNRPLVPSQVNAWQSVTLLPISCKSIPPVPARVEEPGSPERQKVVSRTKQPFSRCPKPARKSRISKMASLCQCVLCRRRRTRPTLFSCTCSKTRSTRHGSTVKEAMSCLS